MSTYASRETRRNRADMPHAAWPRGREPRLRRRKRDAYQDLAAGLARHLAREPLLGSTAEWTEWALRTGAGCGFRPAPDGTRWSVTTRIDY
jgi:hypothetical protein